MHAVEMSWSPEQLSWSVSLSQFSQMCGALVLGRAYSRMGPHRLLILSALLCAAALLALASSSQLGAALSYCLTTESMGTVLALERCVLVIYGLCQAGFFVAVLPAMKMAVGPSQLVTSRLAGLYVWALQGGNAVGPLASSLSGRHDELATLTAALLACTAVACYWIMPRARPSLEVQAV